MAAAASVPSNVSLFFNQDTAQRSGRRAVASLCFASGSGTGVPRTPFSGGLVLRSAEVMGGMLIFSSWRRRRGKGLFPVLCSLEESSPQSSSPPPWWKQFQQKAVAPEKILRVIASATSSPICQFIDSPTTVLHSMDPRIKLGVFHGGFSHDRRSLLSFHRLVWLLALVIIPARSPVFMRYGIVLYLALLSTQLLPTRVWMDQLGRVAFLSGILFVSLALGSDGAPSLAQPRNPPAFMTGLASVPPSLSGYSYSILKLGPLHITRKGFLVASTSACLTFTIFQSASLCLATTTPEQLASALRWFLLPFTAVGAPVAEIILTLLLSLRFINLVFDEVRSVALGIIARRIKWQKLTLMETLDVFVMYVRRIFKNIFNHAEQISQAMIVRGFRGDCSSHRIHLDFKRSLGIADVVSLFCLSGLVAITIMSESSLT